MFFSKASTATLFLRLTPSRGHSFAIWSTIGALIVWEVVSTFLVAIRCHSLRPWTDTAQSCPNMFVRWKFIGALDILTELALFSISVYLVWGLQMALKSKSIVVAAFGCRLPLIVVIVLRLYYLHIQIHSANPTFSAAATVSCTQFEIGFSILASIIPCLKPFMAPYEGPSPNTHSAYGYRGGNYKLSSIASFTAGNNNNNNNNNTTSSSTGKQGPKVNVHKLAEDGLGQGTMKLRPEEMAYEAKAEYKEREENSDGGRSIDSGNSRRMIIKKNVEWSVDYDARNPSPMPSVAGPEGGAREGRGSVKDVSR